MGNARPQQLVHKRHSLNHIVIGEPYYQRDSGATQRFLTFTLHLHHGLDAPTACHLRIDILLRTVILAYGNPTVRQSPCKIGTVLTPCFGIDENRLQ